jgi:hypothetical protein
MENYSKVFNSAAKIDEQIADLNAQIKKLKEKRDELIGGFEVGAYDGGDYVLEVTVDRRFNAAQAEKVLSKSLFNKICKKVPDSKLAHKYLTGEQYASCQKINGTKATLKKVED